MGKSLGVWCALGGAILPHSLRYRKRRVLEYSAASGALRLGQTGPAQSAVLPLVGQPNAQRVCPSCRMARRMEWDRVLFVWFMEALPAGAQGVSGNRESLQAVERFKMLLIMIR